MCIWFLASAAMRAPSRKISLLILRFSFSRLLMRQGKVYIYIYIPCRIYRARPNVFRVEIAVRFSLNLEHESCTYGELFAIVTEITQDRGYRAER